MLAAPGGNHGQADRESCIAGKEVRKVILEGQCLEGNEWGSHVRDRGRASPSYHGTCQHVIIRVDSINLEYDAVSHISGCEAEEAGKDSPLYYESPCTSKIDCRVDYLTTLFSFVPAPHLL
jgi:hypothetical protein